VIIVINVITMINVITLITMINVINVINHCDQCCFDQTSLRIESEEKRTLIIVLKVSLLRK